jgi:putative peptidoglycan lipid II flippase
MSLPFNVVIIASLFVKNIDITTVSIVTTIGWFLHIVIQLPDFYRKGYSFFVPCKGMFKGGKVQNTLETAFIFISGLMLQLCFMTDKIFAGFDTGVVSTLSYASNLFITFSGMFVVAMSSVVFPAISQNYEHGEMDYVRELIRYMIKLMVSIFAFYLVAVVFFGDFAVSMIYERGAFTHADTIAVTWAFIIYSLGIFGYLAQNILNKLFYLAGKYRVTVMGTIIVVAINALVDYFLAPVYGTYFVAITTTVLLTFYAVFTAIKLKSIIGNYITKELAKALGKIALSTLMSVVAVILFIPFTSKYGSHDVYTILQFILAAVVYAVSLLATGVLKDLFTTPLARTAKNKEDTKHEQ